MFFASLTALWSALLEWVIESSRDQSPDLVSYLGRNYRRFSRIDYVNYPVLVLNWQITLDIFISTSFKTQFLSGIDWNTIS